MEKDEKIERFAWIVKFEGMTSLLIPAYEISDCIWKGLKSLLIYNKGQRKNSEALSIFCNKKIITYAIYNFSKQEMGFSL